jgi:DNA transformation protein
MADTGFLDFVLDQLASLPGVRHRRMFGGVGLYQEDLFFAIIGEGRLYFKVDETTVGAYERAGMEAFHPTPDQVLKTYYEVPVDVLEDDAELCRWAQAAIDVQRRSAKAGKVKTKRRRT